MKTYLIDLDGTMYSGNTNIDGAREFIAYLQEKGFPYIFLTNKRRWFLYISNSYC